MEISFIPCGDCTVCCEGYLIGNAYGNNYGHGKKCIFLVSKKCSIYTSRPEACKKYQCAWTQGLFPEQFRPDKSGVLVTVQTNKQTGKQFLKVTEISEKINNEIDQHLHESRKENDTYYIKC